AACQRPVEAVQVELAEQSYVGGRFAHRYLSLFHIHISLYKRCERTRSLMARPGASRLEGRGIAAPQRPPWSAPSGWTPHRKRDGREGKSIVKNASKMALPRSGASGGRADAPIGVDHPTQVGDRERLEQIVGEGEALPPRLVHLRGPARDGDDRPVLPTGQGAQLRQEVEAAQVGQQEVLQHDVGIVGAGKLEPGLSVARLDDVPYSPQGQAHEISEGLVVIDDQNDGLAQMTFVRMGSLVHGPLLPGSRSQ